MLNIVNGYLCLNCADVALAQKDINPAKPQDNPQSPSYDPAQAKADRGPAFSLGGALASPSATGAPAAQTPAATTPANSTPASPAIQPTGLNITV